MKTLRLALALLMLATATPGLAEEVIALLPHDDSKSLTGSADSKPRGETAAAASSSNNGWEDLSPPAEPQGLQTRHFAAQNPLACSIPSKPGALRVVNEGTEPLPPGTRVKWQLKGTDLRGYFAIIGALDAGATLMADNVLEALPSGTIECTARVI